MNSSEPIIELKGVSKSFGNKIILDNADLKIYEGDALVIIGPSGTGKSTILRIIAGLIEPDQGEIYVKGKKRVGLIEDHQEFLAVSMVFQQAALFDSLTVRENIGFSLYQHSTLSHDKIKEIVDHSLQMVSLPTETANLYPAELSGGMRKRVGLARAIALRPQILLYDEPTTGLDPVMTDVVDHLILSTQQKLGITSVVISHDIHAVYTIADKIAMLHEGKILLEGNAEVFKTTQNLVVKNFLEGKASPEQLKEI